MRTTAVKVERDRKGERGMTGFLLFLSLLFAAPFAANVHVAVGASVFAVLGSLIGLRHLRKRPDRTPIVGIDDTVIRKVLALPSPLPDPVAWRLDRALHAVHHLTEMLEHGPFGGDLPDAAALRSDASTCLAHVVDRSEALADLYAVAGPSEAIISARKTVQREIDEHLIELSGALDAAATYVASGTSDAAEGLRLRAQQLHAIAGGVRELEGKALPPSATAALPPSS